VLYAGFDLMDLRDIDFGSGSDCGRRILGNLARFGESLGGRQFRLPATLQTYSHRSKRDPSPALCSVKSIHSPKSGTKNTEIFVLIPPSMIPQMESGSLGGNRWPKCPKLG